VTADAQRTGVTAELRRTAGPGSGPGGAPTAIALSPILSARYRTQDLDRIRAAAPGARIVTLSREGLTDEPVDDVEVLLRGWLSSDAFDRLLGRAPRLSWVHSASAGVERALTPAARDVPRIEEAIVEGGDPTYLVRFLRDCGLPLEDAEEAGAALAAAPDGTRMVASVEIRGGRAVVELAPLRGAATTEFVS
jgi:hypothetical protein